MEQTHTYFGVSVYLVNSACALKAHSGILVDPTNKNTINVVQKFYEGSEISGQCPGFFFF